MSLRVVLLSAACVLIAANASPAAKPRIGTSPSAAAGSGGVTTPGPGDWRVPDPQNVLVIDTTKGRILVELQPLAAPATTDRIRTLARKGFYDGLTFFRVIDDFMDQTGDPSNNGTGGSPLPNLAAEISFRRGSDMPFTLVSSSDGEETGFLGGLPVISQPLQLAAFTVDGRVNAHGDFCQGVGGMARAAALDSGNSQFFLMRGSRDALNDNYAAWGEVISGIDVVRAIKVGEPPAVPQDKMLTVRVLADLPPATRPKIRVVDTASPWFAAYLSRTRTAKGSDFSICDLDIPSDVK